MSNNEYRFPHEDVFPHEEIAERRRWILRYAKKGGVGAEFGVFRGHFSSVILSELSPSKLYLVDPWTKQGKEYFNWGEPPYEMDYTNFNKLKISEAKRDAEERVKPYGDVVDIVEEFEDVWLNEFSGKLDFVYLDSSHFYKDTIKTLSLIHKVLSEDGVILGDDWYEDAGHYSGVCRAVNEFCKTHNYEIALAGQDAQFYLRRVPEYTHPAQHL
jgi:hypothetical protein